MVESINIELFKYGALGKFGSKTLVGSGRVTCRELLQDCKRLSSEVSSTVRLSNGESIDLHHTIKITESRDCVLKVEAGNFEMTLIPEHNEVLWGPMPLPRLPEGVDNSCSVANHRIRNADGEVMFTARVIHSSSLMTSVVHVYYHDKLSVVCHLIGSDTLPTPSQVQSSVENPPISLSPQDGEQAMIIKNNEGDWAILVGRWTGVRKGVPGVKATKHKAGRAHKGSPGHLEVTLFRLPTYFVNHPKMMMRRFWELMTLIKVNIVMDILNKKVVEAGVYLDGEEKMETVMEGEGMGEVEGVVGDVEVVEVESDVRLIAAEELKHCSRLTVIL
ncbi:uncharacterized protein LOC133196936 [Saccostrea echinata]|uniref:uncharacterized protein LOC133196936 n=1 Tax=Saccostrea echinata TaxID=191078 RepID=UPI002A82DA40|nr:uncharacterized protein LOC133196936 [Saccostrea echinata]